MEVQKLGISDIRFAISHSSNVNTYFIKFGHILVQAPLKVGQKQPF